MFPTASGYTKEQLTACESVILELSRVLGKYWQYIFIVGGFVPTLIANDPADPHRGTLDVDLALNHLEIPEEHTPRFMSFSLDTTIGTTQIKQNSSSIFGTLR